jgi:3-oxoacyl-[acyl-carrier protein] reductase
VTGASGVLGAAIARTLGRDGFHVLCHGASHPAQAEAVASEIVAAGGTASACAFDVTDRAATAAALERLVADGGPIQVVINNAGIFDDGPLAGMRPEQWDRVIDVSLNGFYNVTQPLVLPMVRTRWGRIVSISSLAGVIGNVGQVNYAAAKAGLHGATKALARELASRGITVNAVAPGVISSPEMDRIFPKERLEALVPMKRAGTADEVASLVRYLCTDDAAYLSGQIIGVNGGMA